MQNKIGFIGQGFIGKNYADDFESRGITVTRYSKEEPYIQNEEKIKECDMVFIAVPTPTTSEGYDVNIIKKVIPITSPGSVVVLKSTILPGLTRKLQKEFSDRIVMHSPEFLSEATAREDASRPFISIVGIVDDTPEQRQIAENVLSVLPPAPFNRIVSAEEAELIKYAHNCSGYTQIIFFNLMYDLASKLGVNWKNVEEAIKADPFVPNRYASPVHKSGRGAGGHCFIKDMAALRQVYSEVVGDPKGTDVIKSMEEKNRALLKDSNKDLELLEGVYGKK